MDGSTAQARRYYHHVANGGTLNERDVARMVEAMETKDAEIARLTAALAEAEARTAELVAGAYEAAALEANALGDGHDGEEMAEAIRALTPADATEALARLIAEAKAEGMREAAEICWSKKDEDDFRYWGAGAVDHQLRGAMIGKQRDIRALAKKEAGE